MEPQSVGKIIPRVLLPYAQQWAERSGMTLLSKILEDEQFGALIERYGEQIATRATNQEWRGKQPVSRGGTVVDGNMNDRHLSNMQDRISALEAEHSLQMAMFEQLRIKIRPLAQALGCCPECFVGVIGCRMCAGRSVVGSYAADRALLEERVVKPLAEQGVPLTLAQANTSSRVRQSNKPTATIKEKTHGRRNG